MQKITYLQHVDSYDGYCSSCEAVTRFGETEPDAEKYPCLDCGYNTVMGMEQALLSGLIELEEE